MVLNLSSPSFVTGLHMNKALYSLSYACVTAGAAGILFAGIYVLVRYRNESLFFQINIVFPVISVLREMELGLFIFS